MHRTPDEPPVAGRFSLIPTLDLNELLLDHTAASFLFRCSETNDLVVVDRAAKPGLGSSVIVETANGFSVEPYIGQRPWGVVTYRIRRLAVSLIVLAIHILI